MIRFLKIFLFVSWMFAFLQASATHNRAGEITYRRIGPCSSLQYEVTIITYTKTSSFQADRPVLDSVYWGDLTPPTSFTRISKKDTINNISINTYINYHTYAGNGRFRIHFADPNRNEGVINIPNSVQVPFYLETFLVINPYLGCGDNSPVLTYPPIDQGCVGRLFIHNPNAFDPDGDSLSYALTVCRGDGGIPIPGYFFPPASHSFSLDSHTGDLIWNAPMTPGEYNVAFLVIEWRHGDTIGYVERDMQILIGTCTDLPPVFQPTPDTCVLAGDSISFDVTATDPNHSNIVVLTSTGGPYLVTDPAVFTPVIANQNTVVSQFFWRTNCQHIRLQPYYVQFKARDIVPPDSISLVTLTGSFIRVIGPAPRNPVALANGNSIDLTWDPPACTALKRYKIYRRAGLYTGTIQCPCDNGVPAASGYTFLDTASAIAAPHYSDNNHGNGLVIGVDYCYLIIAVYGDGSESCASPQVCAALKKDLAVITNADVRWTDVNTGSVYVAWSKPTELDTVLYPGPYQYRLFHSPDFFVSAGTIIATMFDLNDTTFIDTIIDTKTHPWSYTVALYYTNSSGILQNKGNSTSASTIYLTLTPTDNRVILTWEEHVPWINSRYDIFRLNTSTSVYDSIGFTSLHTYTDSNLVNGQTYCYYVRSTGSYLFPGFVDPILNRSQQECSSPLDNVPPCAPITQAKSFCIDNLNKLTWNNPNHTCADDVLKYYIYFAPTETAGYERIDSLLSPDDTVYYHRQLRSLAGCYKVTAVDSVGNETISPVVVCVDTCRQYVLPSVFTPNGDGVNDFFHPCDSTTTPELQLKNCPPYLNVKDVDMKIFNRWGKIVFETSDKNINWDGKAKESGMECSDGVYYYTCKVNFYRVRGIESVNLNGFVHLIRSK